MYLLNAMGSFLGHAVLPFRVLLFFGDFMNTVSFCSSLLPTRDHLTAAHFLNVLDFAVHTLLHRCGVLEFLEAAVGTWVDFSSREKLPQWLL